ncbi:polyprenyl synthetase family protein [Campylobacter sp. 19-13652]|uniref:polyprenyl synthetase family protein n=1 Tax=Campylobacter sp. 19-13652 TaxID=2840180 RepID=UPI001C7723BE|nr:polyprenyl synthetase family protein [Campylobacter sp. 19-13652]BCX78723.1 geranyltranstransferase [Campylobacter sp. 19-13652]
MNLADKFDEYLKANLPRAASFHPHYEKALGVMLLAGGKHFRAQLVLGVVNALRPELTKAAMPVALGVEMMHTYSLIHDDLPAMDNADFRRGTPTLHKTYDEVTAILAGDALNTHSFLLIAEAGLPDFVRCACVRELAKGAGVNGMVLGQAIDCYFENKPLNLSQLEFLHIHKTACLIAASLKIGAIITEASQKEQDKIYEVGIRLGLVFQIADDIIDATSNAEEAGKPVGHDKSKNSFTNLLGLEGAKAAKAEHLALIQAELKTLPNSIENMIQNLISKYLKD